MDYQKTNNTPYVHHTILLPSSLPGHPPTKISALLHPSMIPLLPDPLPFSTPYISDRPFKVMRTPTKGFGMFAIRLIPRGSLIIIEHPIFVVPAEPLPKSSSYEIYEDVGRRMGRKDYEEMLVMANWRDRDECPSVVEGVARTNALALQFRFPSDDIALEGGRYYGGVFPKINRCNHSCGPNAVYKWNLSMLASSLYALRDINEGEEITNTYTDPTRCRSERMEKLEFGYSFKCDCRWCASSESSPPPAESSVFPSPTKYQSKSDNTRLQLSTYIATHPTYTKWSIDLCLPDDFVISSHLSTLPYIQDEGLQGLLPLFIEEIAWCYAELGNEDQFRKWAEEFVKTSSIGDVSLACKFDSILEDPKRMFRRWGWRKKIREREGAYFTENLR